MVMELISSLLVIISHFCAGMTSAMWCSYRNFDMFPLRLLVRAGADLSISETLQVTIIIVFSFHSELKMAILLHFLRFFKFFQLVKLMSHGYHVKRKFGLDVIWESCIFKQQIITAGQHCTTFRVSGEESQCGQVSYSFYSSCPLSL